MKKTPEINKTYQVYMYELTQSTIKKNETKYKLILEFINKIAKLNLTSLCDFVDIDVDKINLEDFNQTLSEYKEKFDTEGINLEKYLTFKNKMKKINIINTIAFCVESINYSVYRKRVNLKKKKISLSILNKQKKYKIKLNITPFSI